MMTALSRALNNSNEQDYIAELVSIRREIEFLEDFVVKKSGFISVGKVTWVRCSERL